MDVDHGQFNLAKRLAHNDKKVRDRSIKIMRKWLVQRKDVTELEMLKLWRGIFYCFWMSDKVPVQQELSQRLANVILKLPNVRAMEYFAGFCDTMMREWTGIDRLRMDKFMSLVRHMLHAALMYLKMHSWDMVLLESFVWILLTNRCSDGVDVSETPGHVAITNTGLWGGVLQLENDKGRGLALHIVDIFFDELDRVDPSSKHFTWEHLMFLLEPFVQIGSRSSDSALVDRCVSRVFAPLVQAAVLEDGWVHRAFDGRLGDLDNFLLAVASDVETKDKLRKRWYSLREIVLEHGVPLDPPSSPPHKGEQEVLDDVDNQSNGEGVAKRERLESVTDAVNGEGKSDRKRKKKRKQRSLDSQMTSNSVDEPRATDSAESTNEVAKKKKTKRHRDDSVEESYDSSSDGGEVTKKKKKKTRKRQLSEELIPAKGSSGEQQPSGQEDLVDNASSTNNNEHTPTKKKKKNVNQSSKGVKIKKTVSFSKTKTVKTFHKHKPAVPRKSKSKPVESLKRSPEKSLLKNPSPLSKKRSKRSQNNKLF